MNITPLDLLVPLSILSCGVGFILAHRVGFKTDLWGYALCFLGAGFAMMLFQLPYISALKQTFEDTLIMVGVILGARALGRRYNVAPRLYFELTILLSSILMIAISLAIFGSVRLETLFAQLGCTAILWQASLASTKYVRSTADRILSGTFLFLSLAMACQCLLYILAPESPYEQGAWRGSIWGSLVQYTGLLASIILAFAVMIANSIDSIEKHRRHAVTDALTNLLNRRGLDAVLTSPQGRRFRDASTAVILADIDHFKAVNDRLGHPFGDLVIAGFAALLKAQAGDRALTARLGGEEFIILLPNMELGPAMAVADRMRCAFEGLCWTQDADRVSCTASFGVTLTRPDEPFSTAIGRADRLLYVAKHNGRNCTVGSDDKASVEAGADCMTIVGHSDCQAQASG